MQTKGEYTPGPWHVEDDGETFYVCHSGTVCTVTAICEIEPDGTQDAAADARLIAAAPEMLEALLAARGSISVFDGARDAVDAAIAKAKGLPS